FRFASSATGLHHSSHSFAHWYVNVRDYAPFSVSLLRGLGEKRMFEVLADEWRRRRRATRWLVRHTVGRRGRTTIPIPLLKAGIRVGQFAPMSSFSRATCAALANVLYWDGVATALERGASTTTFNAIARTAA